MKRLTRIFFVLVLLLGLIVFSAPWILSTSHVRELILNQINSSMDATLAIRSWSIQWIQGIELNGIRLTAPDGKFCFEAKGIKIAFKLPALAKAVYALTRTEKGNPVQADLDGEINLFRGRISTADQSGSTVLITNLNASVKIDALNNPYPFIIAGKQDQNNGSITITGSVQILPGGVFDPESVNGTVTITLQNWDAAPVISFMNTNKSLPDIDGYLSGALTVAMEGIHDISAKGKVAMEHLEMQGNRIPGDTLTFDKISLQIDADKKGHDVSIKTFILDGPPFRASVYGDLTLFPSNDISTANLKINGKINLANVTTLLPERMMPAMTSVASDNRNGTLDINGNIQIDMTGKTNLLDALTLSVLAELDELNIATVMAMVPTREFLPQIQGNLRGKLDARMKGIESLETKGTIVIESLRMAGGFLRHDRPSADTVRLDFDLAKAGQKVTLNTCKLKSVLLNTSISGSFAQFAKQRIPPANLLITGNLNIAEAMRQFPDTLNIQKELTFAQGSLELNAQFETDKQNINFEGTLNTSNLTAHVQGSAIQLDKPIILSAKGMLGETDFQLDRFDLSSSFLSGYGKGNMDGMSVDLEANIATALNEAAKFIDLNGKSGSGQFTVQMTLKSHNLQKKSLSAKARLSDFNLIGFTEKPIHMNNAEFNLGATANLDENKKINSITDMSLSTLSEPASIQIKCDRFIPDSDGNPILQGLTLHTESDMAQLMTFVRSFAQVPKNMIIIGKANLTSQCSVKDNVLSIPRFNVNLSPFTFHWKDSLIVDKAISSEGTITLPVSATNALDMLNKADVNSILSVQFIKFFGIEISDVKIPLQIRDALIQLNIESIVNQGKMILPLYVDAGQDPAILSIPDKSEILSEVRLTNEMFDQLIEFVSPLLKGCAVTSGSISAKIDQCRIPLNTTHIQKMKFKGLSSLHSVTLSSGGILNNILSLAKLQDEAIIILDQDIHFVYRNGRIYSSQMVLNIGGYNIIISGSVGLDKTLDYIIKIPITREMVGENIYKHLKGKIIQLPVGGTVNNPVFNKNKFLGEAAKTAGQAGSNLLIEEGIKFLQDLLKK